jgi:hypothetical protein
VTILGTKPSPSPDGLPAGAPRGREAERILAAELLAEFRHFQQSQTAFVERIAGRITNHVLAVRTVQVDAAGDPITLTFGTPIGAVRVRAAGHAVTVVAGPATGSVAPTTGTGVWTVPANTADTIPIAAAEVTLWGTAADLIGVQAYSAGPLVVS